MILNRAPELLAVYIAKARFFSLTSGNATADQMADIFKIAAKKITKEYSNWTPPFAAKIHGSGHIELALNSKKMKKRLEELGVSIQR